MIEHNGNSSNSSIELCTRAGPADAGEKGTQGENTTPASDVLQKREIWAWYSYDGATSVYSVAITVLIPLVLNSLATDYVCQGLTHGCDSNGEPISTNESSEVNFLGAMVKPASYASYVISCSVVFQAILFVSVGPAADFGSWRKNMLVVAATLGSLLTLFQAFLCGSSRNWLLVGLLFMFINGVYGLSIVCYNAFLIILAEHHPNVWLRIEDGDSVEEIEKEVAKLTDGMSARGYALGYVAGVFANIVFVVLLFTITGITKEDSDIFGVANDDEDLQVDQRFNQGVNGFRVWINEDGIVSGMQLKFQIFGWADVIGNSVTEETFMSNEGNMDNVADIRAYSQGGLLTGFSIFRGSWENFGDTSSSLQVHNFKSSEKLIFGGLLAHLNNDKNIVQAVSFYYYNPNGIYDTSGLAACLVFVGLWWLIVTYAGVGFNLAKYPGEPLPQRNIVALSLKRVCGTLGKVRKLPNLWKFMLGFFFWGDGITTIQFSATLFMVQEINMEPIEIITCFLISNISGALGNIGFHRFQRRYNLTSLQMFWIPLITLVVFCVYPLFGFFDLGFGLVTKEEVYFYVCVYGVNVAVIQSYGRVVLCSLIPLNQESEIFSLYEITDKGSSWLGPLVAGMLNQAGNMRYAMLYGIWAFGIAIPIVWTVDAREGQLQAGRLETKL